MSLVGCVGDESPPPGEARGDYLWIQPTAGCAEPVDGFDGWSEQAADRGFDLRGELPEGLQPNSFGGALVAEDLDGDLDIDIAGATADGVVSIYENDGSGHFTHAASVFPPWQPGDRIYVGLAAVDLNDDGRPDLVHAGTNAVRMAWNLGGLDFSNPEPLATGLTDSPINQFATLSFGDADGDGQLDLLLPGFAAMGNGGPPVGAPDLYMLREPDGDGWGEPQELDNPFVPSQSFCGVWTDQNRDGDRDILLTTVGLRPFALFRTEGRVDDRLIQRDEAESLGLDRNASAMGIAEADLNEDGVPDYVVSDMGRPVTLVSQPDGSYAESGLALGLTFDAQERIIGWSIEVEDLDNDGVLDIALTGGHSGASFRAVAEDDYDHPDYVVQHPDTLWRGGRAEDGLRFRDVTEEVGFGDIANHYGQAAADFDGDGFLDLAMGSVDGPWKLWMNTCSEGQWVEVDFEGAPGNRAGWGAIARIEVGGRVQERELLGTRGYGQAPSRLHFGLGEYDTVDSLEVTWPDGASNRWENLPAGAVLTAKHPLAE